MKLTVIDLCSGIGGFSYGLERTGYFKTIQFVEINNFCQKVLKKNFPNVPIHNDIKTYNPVEAEVVTSGFPCTPFSIAGKLNGKNDNKNLWRQTLRVIKKSKPTFFIGENVFGIVKLYLDTILKDLEEAGYSTRCFNISASGVGARHRRKRIWIIAYSNTGLCNREKEKIQARWITTNNGNQIKVQKNWWQNQRELFGTPDGITTELHENRRERIKALGNSLVSQIPYYIGIAIYNSFLNTK